MVFIIAAGALGALSASGCASSSAVHPDARDATWAAERWPGTSVAELEKGRAVFVSRCGSCHQLPSPGVKTPEEWPHMLGEMADRAHLSESDRELVLHYLGATSERLRHTAG